MAKSSLTEPKINIASTSEAICYVAERLKLVRRIRNMTLENMASQLGITRKQLQNYESAQSNITVARLWEISNLLDVETGFFVEGMNSSKQFINNEDLDLIRMFKNIKDRKAKDSLIGILKEI